MTAPPARGRACRVVIPCFNERATVGRAPRPGARLAVDGRGHRRRRRLDRRHRASSLEKVDDPRVRVLRHERNPGKGAALRTGFAAVERRVRHRPGRRPRVRPGGVRRRARAARGRAGRRRVRLPLPVRPPAPRPLLLALARQPAAHAAVEHVHRPQPHGHGDLLQGVPPRGPRDDRRSRRTASASSPRSPPRSPGAAGASTRSASPTPGAPTPRARRSAGATACGRSSASSATPVGSDRLRSSVERRPAPGPTGEASRTPQRVTSSIDSTTIRPDIFDLPERRSRNTIGVSITRQPGPHQPADQLGQEGVALGRGRVRLDRPQRRGPVGAEAGRAVADLQPEHQRRVAVAPPRQQPAVHRPVDGAAAGHVARADHGVGAGVDQAQQLGQHRRVVGEVDVHRHDHVVALVEGEGEARAGRRCRGPACRGGAAA